MGINGLENTGGTDRGTKFRLTVSFLAALLASCLAAASASALDPPPPPPPVKVIVQQLNGSDMGPSNLVTALGGQITKALPIVSGFAATVPLAAIPDIAAHPGVRVVSPDHAVLPQDVAPAAPRPSVHREVVGSSAANAAGLTGAGTTVAIIDTGIADVPRLAGRVRTVVDAAGITDRCINLSTEPGCQDSYGHGTFVAGMVNSVAPAADLISIKLSGRDGTSNISTVLTALQWVVGNRDAYGIKVLNLSMRTDSGLSYRLDPLNLAVEQVWAKGITLVVSAGNQGPGPRTIAKPGDDPWVITVGAIDDQGTAPVADDTVADFSSRGPTYADALAKPDVAAPGRSLISLRSPGSEADLKYPYFVDAERRYGSGTSFSSPVVAGAAALLHQADPLADNDRVKFALMQTARPLMGPNETGRGVIDIMAAVKAPAGKANQGLFHPQLSPRAVPSVPDVFGTQFAGIDFLTTPWQGTNWQRANWQGTNWQGTNWQGTNWQGTNWQATTWQGTNWQGTNWQGTNWQGTNWQGTNWQGTNWQAGYWS